MGKLLVHPCDHWGLTCESETFANNPSLKMYKVSICNYVYTTHASLFANGTRLYCFISDCKSIHNFTNMMVLTTDIRNFSYTSWRTTFNVKNLVFLEIWCVRYNLSDVYGRSQCVSWTCHGIFKTSVRHNDCLSPYTTEFYLKKNTL